MWRWQPCSGLEQSADKNGLAVSSVAAFHRTFPLAYRDAGPVFQEQIDGTGKSVEVSIWRV